MKTKRRLLAFFFSVLLICQGCFPAKAEEKSPSVFVKTETGSREEEDSREVGVLGSIREINEGTDAKSEEDRNSKEEALTEEESNLGTMAEDGNAAEAVESKEEDRNAAEAAEGTAEDGHVAEIVESNEHKEKSREQESNHPITFTKELVNGGIQEVKDSEGSSHYLLEYLVRFDGKNFEGTHQENGYENVIFQDTLENEMLRFFNPAYYNVNSDFKNKEQYIPHIRRGVWRSGEYREDGSGKKIFIPAEDDEANPGSVFSLRTDEEGSTPAEEKQYPDINYIDRYWNLEPGGMQYELGHMKPNEGFEIRYFVEIVEFPVKGSVYKNKAELLNVEVKAQEHSYTVKEAADSFDQSGFSIKVRKTDKQDGTPLEGGEFLVYSLNTGYRKIIVSGKDGIATVNNLIKESYNVKEVNPPLGYKMGNREEDFVMEEQFNESSEILLEYQNEKKKVEDPDKRDILVRKDWILKPGVPSPASLPIEDLIHDDALNVSDEEYRLSGEGNATEGDNTLSAPSGEDTSYLGYPSMADFYPKVTVHLLRNGKRFKTAILRDDDFYGLYHRFTDLDRRDENGKEIEYTVEEEPIDGFKTVITGSQDTKFVITNAHYLDAKTAIPVTKIWKGEGPHPRNVKVLLLANGKVVDEVILNDGNDWQHTFQYNKTDVENQAVKFEIKEIPVEGYDTAIEHNEATGYINVLVNSKKSEAKNPEENNPEKKDTENSEKTQDTPGSGNHQNPSNEDNTPNPPDTTSSTLGTGNISNNSGRGIASISSGSGNSPRVLGASIPTGTSSSVTTVENNGEVLGADRAASTSETAPTAQVLGAERDPKDLHGEKMPQVLGANRGSTKTADYSGAKLYFVLFLLSTLGFFYSLLYKKRSLSRMK